VPCPRAPRNGGGVFRITPTLAAVQSADILETREGGGPRQGIDQIPEETQSMFVKTGARVSSREKASDSRRLTVCEPAGVLIADVGRATQ
jgi:hypothetical protein